MLEPISLYVHWPWCKNKCPYCDFNSHTLHRELEEEYVECLLLELKKQRDTFGKRPISTIFFGGGTPSLMQPAYVEKIIDRADELFGVQNDAEITLENNPTSSNFDKFKAFKQAGVNRFSIGVQSLTDSELKFLGREHSVEDALKTVEAALHTTENVSFDLIYGLPNQNLTTWQNNLQQSVSLGVKHISAYQLTIERNTKFYSQVKRGQWQPLNDDIQADFFEATTNVLQKHNFTNYETSNYCVNGYECRHNFNIWQYNDYIGIGAGAHGRIKNAENKRILTQNYKQPNSYTDSVKHRETHFYAERTLTPLESGEEQVIMGLRLQQGIPLNDIVHVLNENGVERMETLGLLSTTNGILKLTQAGWLLLDTILGEILNLNT